MPGSNGTPRSLQHERRNVVVRVRGCRMNTLRHIYGVQTQQGARFSDVLLVQKYWAKRKLSWHIRCGGNEAMVQGPD